MGTQGNVLVAQFGADAGKQAITNGTSPGDLVTLGTIVDGFIQDYELRQFRTLNTARGRVTHLEAYFSRDCPVDEITAVKIRAYQVTRARPGTGRTVAVPADVTSDAPPSSRRSGVDALSGDRAGGTPFSRSK